MQFQEQKTDKLSDLSILSLYIGLFAQQRLSENRQSIVTATIFLYFQNESNHVIRFAFIRF